MDDALERLQKNLGYRFKDVSLLKTALSHSSYAHENGENRRCNERFEFLGDALLGFVAAKYFYDNYDAPEGDLTRLRAAKVCESAICSFAKELEIGPALLLGKSETITGGENKTSILADAFEAVLAAVFLDGGLKKASELALRFISRSEILDGTTDYKTILQEIIQKKNNRVLDYGVVGETGPDHFKTFAVEARIDGRVVGRGWGLSKKIAEQAAAREALEAMGVKLK